MNRIIGHFLWIFSVAALLTGIAPASAVGQVFRGYYSNGSIEFKAKQDATRRIIKGYYPSGGLRFVAVYHHGKLNGITREYFETGRIKAEIEFEDNERNGEARFYYPSGILMGKIAYKKDQEVGLARYYDESGMLIATLTNKKAVRERIDRERLERSIEKEAARSETPAKAPADSSPRNK